MLTVRIFRFLAPLCALTAVPLAMIGIKAASKPPRVRFEDASASSELSFVLNHNPTPSKYLVETMAGGVSAFDYNNDGRMDLFFTKSCRLSPKAGDSFPTGCTVTTEAATSPT